MGGGVVVVGTVLRQREQQVESRIGGVQDDPSKQWHDGSHWRASRRGCCL